MNTDIQKIPRTVHTLMMATLGGKIYFKAAIPNLSFKDDYQSKNFHSPFREDKKPSCIISCDRYTNTWLYKDFGDSSISGNMFAFASKRYGLSLKSEFPQVIDKIFEELRIDEWNQVELLRLLKGITTNETQHFDLNIPYKTIVRDDNYNDHSPVEQQMLEIEEIELDFLFLNALSKNHSKYLKETGIDFYVMKEYNCFFIRGYTIRYKGDNKPLERRAPENIVWIAYRFDGFCKIYQPDPKKFWFIGNKPKGQKYYFGTPLNFPRFNKPQTVILTAGEKDALSLLSREYCAMCVNSETSAFTEEDYQYWTVECNYSLITLYDLDSTGIKQAQKLNNRLRIPYILLPEWVKEKGGKDVTDFFKLGGTEAELNELIKTPLTQTIIDLEIDSPLKTLPVRTAMQRLEDAKSQPNILPHADVLFQYNELSIFFGDTGKGKSIFAVALADAISKGIKVLGLENAYPPLKVLYYDFELSDKQFEKRYSDDTGNLYQFSDNFFIDNINLSEINFDNKKFQFEELLIKKIEADLNTIGASVLIIDNITFLSMHTPEDGQVAMRLMKLLKELKTSQKISILVLAHTPKKFGLGGISLPDLAGSKHLANFCDSVTALGVSKRDSNLRYIIQVKPSRTGEIKYDSQNVILCEIQKIDSFLTLTHVGFAKEEEHLHSTSKEAEEEMIERAKELRKQNKTFREIAEIIGVGKSTIGRWLKGE